MPGKAKSHANGNIEFTQPELEALAKEVARYRQTTITKVRREVFQRASELLSETEIPASRITQLKDDLMRVDYDARMSPGS